MNMLEETIPAQCSQAFQNAKEKAKIGRDNPFSKQGQQEPR